MISDKINRPFSLWAVIPTYNNAATIRDVVERTLKQSLDGVLVIDDGSTDCNVTGKLSGIDAVTIIKHERNMGKGKALQTALAYLNALNVTYMITLDGDAQHYPEDIANFLPSLAQDDHSIVIGARDFSEKHIPASSNFGRKFSNFWIKIETGCKVEDAQSGFRAYPVKYISQLRFLSSYYNFEIEVLVRASWAGITLKNIPIRVWYPENPKDRVSSFRPFLDNFRIALINIHLIGLRMLPIPHKKLVKSTANDTKSAWYFLRHPLIGLRELLFENATPGGLAAAAGVGAFLAILPLVGFHTAAIVYASVRLHLNKVMAINIQHFFMPPLTPILCIETGYFIRHGKWLTSINFNNLLSQIPSLILEWWIGAVVLCLPLSLLTALIVYVTTLLIRRKKHA